jgi:hypothetical protein
MKVESKEFWEKVKEEWDATSTYDFICFRSPTFEKIWDDPNTMLSIYLLANEFLIKHKEVIFKIGCGDILFKGSESKVEMRKIRQNFINWCIEKFSYM